MSTALITGASAGLGAEYCRQLAARGHDLVLVARDEARLVAFADELHRTYGVSTQVLAADLSDRAQTQRVADRLGDPDHPVDVLVNNAGFGMRAGFLAGDLRDEERAVEVMIRAVLVLSHAAARAMVERGSGSIITVASVAAYAAMGTYSAAKSWAKLFTEGLDSELAGTGVRAIAVCPGFTHTEFHQRASMNMSRLPAAGWLTAPQVVAESLDDLAKGKAVSVPSARYKTLVAAMTVLPRPVLRRASQAIGGGRRTGR